jgi:hypothetical protein
MATITTITQSPAPVAPVKVLRTTVERLIDEARTEQLLVKLANQSDPRTSRERRLAWKNG